MGSGFAGMVERIHSESIERVDSKNDAEQVARLSALKN
jgi:hypothetical protein